MKRLMWTVLFGLCLGLQAWTAAHAQSVFLKYGPANGIQVNTGSTYVNTAATSANVIALWSGSCSSSTFLRGDGACAAAGGGSVSSVALTMPSGFSVSGSPVTSSGTLAVTTSLNGVLKGNGSGFTTSVAADIVGLFSGCSGTQYLGADGACHSAGGGSVSLTAADTTLTLSPSTITGTGTLAVNQAAAFTWAGVHEFDGGVDIEQIASNVNSFQINGMAGTPGVPLLNMSGSPTTGASNGIALNVGTNASDFPLAIQNQAGTLQLFALHGDGGIEMNSPTGGDKGIGSINLTGAVYQNGTSWPLGNCTIAIGLAGTGTPTVASSRGCASPSVSRTALGVYHLNDSTVSSSLTAYCALDSSTPFTFTTSVSSLVIVSFYNPAGSAADPPSGATLRCSWGG